MKIRDIDGEEYEVLYDVDMVRFEVLNNEKQLWIPFECEDIEKYLKNGEITIVEDNKGYLKGLLK